MKKRAREIGGNIKFVSKMGKGTKVVLNFPK
jgi:signal transduction histidine kinase